MTRFNVLDVPDDLFDDLPSPDGDVAQRNGHAAAGGATPAAASQRHSNGQHDAAQSRATSSSSRLPTISFEELAARPHKPKEMLFADVLPARESTLLYGLERSFKSFYALEQAICLALGQPFLGHFDVIGRRTVLVLDLENPEDEFYRRVHASLERRGLSDAAMTPYFRVYDRSQTTERFWFNTLQLERMRGALEHDKPAFVVVDNLRRGVPAGQDENTNKDMVPIMRAMDEMCTDMGIALAVVHHDRRDGSGASGGGGLLSTPANDIHLVPDRNTSITTVRCGSMRHCRSFLPFTITVDAGGVLILVQKPEDMPRREQPRSHDTLVHDALEETNRAMSTEELMAHTKLSRGQAERAIKALITRGDVIERGKGESGGGRAPTTYGLRARSQDHDTPTRDEEQEPPTGQETSFHHALSYRGLRDEKKFETPDDDGCAPTDDEWEVPS